MAELVSVDDWNSLVGDLGDTATAFMGEFLPVVVVIAVGVAVISLGLESVVKRFRSWLV